MEPFKYSAGSSPLSPVGPEHTADFGRSPISPERTGQMTRERAERLLASQKEVACEPEEEDYDMTISRTITDLNRGWEAELEQVERNCEDLQKTQLRLMKDHMRALSRGLSTQQQQVDKLTGEFKRVWTHAQSDLERIHRQLSSEDGARRMEHQSSLEARIRRLEERSLEEVAERETFTTHVSDESTKAALAREALGTKIDTLVEDFEERNTTCAEQLLEFRAQLSRERDARNEGSTALRRHIEQISSELADPVGVELGALRSRCREIGEDLDKRLGEQQKIVDRLAGDHTVVKVRNERTFSELSGKVDDATTTREHLMEEVDATVTAARTNLQDYMEEQVTAMNAAIDLAEEDWRGQLQKEAFARESDAQRLEQSRATERSSLELQLAELRREVIGLGERAKDPVTLQEFQSSQACKFDELAKQVRDLRTSIDDERRTRDTGIAFLEDRQRALLDNVLQDIGRRFTDNLLRRSKRMDADSSPIPQASGHAKPTLNAGPHHRSTDSGHSSGAASVDGDFHTPVAGAQLSSSGPGSPPVQAERVEPVTAAAAAAFAASMASVAASAAAGDASLPAEEAGSTLNAAVFPHFEEFFADGDGKAYGEIERQQHRQEDVDDDEDEEEEAPPSGRRDSAINPRTVRAVSIDCSWVAKHSEKDPLPAQRTSGQFQLSGHAVEQHDISTPLMSSLPEMVATTTDRGARRRDSVFISGHLGRRPINGEYKPLGRKYMDAPVYFCRQANAYLFHSARNVSWGIGDRPSGGLLALVQDAAKSATDVSGVWKVYGGQNLGWIEDPCITLTPKPQEEGRRRSVVVESRETGVAGGYRKTEEVKHGAPVYMNDDDGKMLWFDGRRWLITSSLAPDGEEAGQARGRAVSAMSAETREVNPEAADWQGLEVVAVAASDNEDTDDDEEDICCGSFVDEEFPPDDASLGRDSAKLGGRQWVRGTQLCWAEPKLFDRGEPGCLMRNAQGDCWLLAAIAAVAEFPGYLATTIFKDRAVSASGRYCLSLYDVGLGSWVEVVIDDLIPCRPMRWFEKRPRPYNAQPWQSELHLLLLEKALAKFVGSYAALADGFESLVWLALTGQEQQICWDRCQAGVWAEKSINIEQQRRQQLPRNFWPASIEETGMRTGLDGLFIHLGECVAANFLLAAAIGEGAGDSAARRTDGLVEGFLYPVLGSREIAGFRLVQLRNPWGSAQQWSGAWNPQSPLWQQHPEVRAACQQCPHEGITDVGGDSEGLFYMAWEEFASIIVRLYISPQDMGMPRAAAGQGRAVPGSAS